MRARTIAISLAALAAALTVTSAAARAREHEEEHEGRGGHHDRSAGATSADPSYLKECGSCHLAYPPRLLPAASWRKLMAGLERHFGQNAELEPAVRQALEGWLVQNAGRDRSGSGEPPLRITTLPWFVDEHDEVPKGAVERPAIRSMANCAACHSGAESWDFDDDRVKIPR
jgi:hypothetical protein